VLLSGWAGVFVFFPISGYCILAALMRSENATLPQFLRRRWRRIVPAYWASLVLVIAVALAAAPFNHYAVGYVNIGTAKWASVLTLTQVWVNSPAILNPVYWTLCYEEQFYLVMALTLLAPARQRLRASSRLTRVHTTCLFRRRSRGCGASECGPCLIDQPCAILHVLSHGLRRARVERHEPLFSALSEHAHHPSARVHVVDVEAGELAEAQARCVEQLENRAVAARERRVAGRRVEQRRHLPFRQVRGHADVALWRRHERARIVVDDLFATQVAQKRADGGQLPRGGRTGKPSLVQLTQEAAQR
jgi:hypothetical protein